MPWPRALRPGLALVIALEESGRLAGYHLLSATKADMYRRLGRADEAAACYREALGLASTDAERRYLSPRLAETAPAKQLAPLGCG